MPDNPHKKRRVVIKLGPKYVLSIIYACLVINLIILLIVAVAYPFIQPVVPLFHSLADPRKHLVVKSWLFLLPAISLLINVIHIQSLKLINNSQELVIKLFTYSDLVLQTVLLMITLRNVLVVFKPF
jgi:hypothetical protein